MSQALCFNDVTLTPVSHQNSIWIKASELARALGYKREDQVAKIYRTNADEFTPDMTQVVEIVDNADLAFPVKTRIFSLRGCHLLSMFARTPIAKAFRKWVLDVLDKMTATTATISTTSTLTPSARAELKAIVDAKLSTYPADVQGKARSEIWVRFNRHFKIAEYAQLPMCQMPDARDYLVEMKPKALATIEARALPTEPAALPPSSVPATRGCFRAKSQTELRLLDMLTEANSLDSLGHKMEDFFSRLGEISGPLNLQAIEAMRRTDDRVMPDSLIQTMHYHRWYARERMRDAVNSAREACRSAIVVARLLGA